MDKPATIDELKHSVLADEYRRHYVALIRTKETLLFQENYLNTVKFENEAEEKELKERFAENEKQGKKEIIDRQAHLSAIESLLNKMP